MIHASPTWPYIAAVRRGRIHRSIAGLVTIMTVCDGIAAHKRGARLPAKRRQGDGMTAFSGVFARSRAHVLICVCEIFNIWCHTVTLLSFDKHTNDLTRVNCLMVCRHIPSLSSRGGVL